MRIGPLGVVISINTCRVPPTRTSIRTTGIVAPSGPYHLAKWSGSVQSCQISSAEASKRRSRTTASTSPVSVIARAFLCELEVLEVVVHAVESVIPDRPVLLSPGRDVLQWSGVERARSVLRCVAALHKPGALEHLDVLGDGRQRQLER